MKSLTRRQALMVLNALPQLGSIAVNELLNAAGGDPVAALTLGAGGIGPLRANAKEALRGWKTRFDPVREEAVLEKMSGAFLIPGDREYPRLLKEIGDTPPGLYRRGNLPEGRPFVAIVGTRRSTGYGGGLAREFARHLARAGCCIVSGMALGIDTAAHHGALETGGATVAVLGTGVDIIYPWANHKLCESIAQSGALLSEFPLGRQPDKVGFVRRNRIISGMCSVVLVVESDRDGGAMITAKFAADQGRTVCAIPGRLDQPTSAGCHQLIREGATLVTEPSEVLSELGVPITPEMALPAAGGSEPADKKLNNRSAEARAILAALKEGAHLSPDALCSWTGIRLEKLTPALMLLELDGWLSKRPDGRYERVRRGPAW